MSRRKRHRVGGKVRPGTPVADPAPESRINRDAAGLTLQTDRGNLAGSVFMLVAFLLSLIALVGIVEFARNPPAAGRPVLVAVLLGVVAIPFWVWAIRLSRRSLTLRLEPAGLTLTIPTLRGSRHRHWPRSWLDHFGTHTWRHRHSVYHVLTLHLRGRVVIGVDTWSKPEEPARLAALLNKELARHTPVPDRQDGLSPLPARTRLAAEAGDAQTVVRAGPVWWSAHMAAPLILTLVFLVPVVLSLVGRLDPELPGDVTDDRWFVLACPALGLVLAGTMLALLLSAARRRTEVEIDGDTLRVRERGLFGSWEARWRREEVADVYPLPPHLYQHRSIGPHWTFIPRLCIRPVRGGHRDLLRFHHPDDVWWLSRLLDRWRQG